MSVVRFCSPPLNGHYNDAVRTNDRSDIGRDATAAAAVVVGNSAYVRTCVFSQSRGAVCRHYCTAAAAAAAGSGKMRTRDAMYWNDILVLRREIENLPNPLQSIVPNRV